MNDFPIFKAGTVFNEFGGIRKKSKLVCKHISLDFPTRLNAMTLDDLATVSGNDNHMSFPAGELLVSIDKPVRVVTKFLGNNDGYLKISNSTKRKALVNHAYLLMCKALDVSPSLSIDVDESNVIKHCGFGSSGAIIGAVCSSINELFGNPIKNLDLITYIASNYGEEIKDIKEVEELYGRMKYDLVGGDRPKWHDEFREFLKYLKSVGVNALSAVRHIKLKDFFLMEDL